MRFVIQVVQEASVEVVGEDGEATMQDVIGKGFAVLVGVGEGDTKEIAQKMVDKMLALRVFADEEGKTNLSLSDVDGSLLLISQFTLYADCRKGNRPSFTAAALPDEAYALYAEIVARCREKIGDEKVGEGSFGAHMRLHLVNEGPFTILLDSEELTRPRRSRPA